MRYLLLGLFFISSIGVCANPSQENQVIPDTLQGEVNTKAAEVPTIVPTKPNQVSETNPNAIMNTEGANQNNPVVSKDTKDIIPQKKTPEVLVKPATDADLNDQITTKLSDDKSLIGTAVRVSTSTNKGVVTLEGTVNSSAQLDAIKQIVQSMVGVKEIHSTIIVKNISSPTIPNTLVKPK